MQNSNSLYFYKMFRTKIWTFILFILLWAACQKNNTPLRQEVIQNIKGKYCGKRADMEIFADSTFICTAKIISGNKTDKNVACKGYYTLTYSEEVGKPSWVIKFSGKTTGVGVGISCTGSFVCWSQDKKYDTQEYKDVLYNEIITKCQK